MSTWAISFTTNFLNTLFMLPDPIKNKLDYVVKILKENPHNSYSKKIVNFSGVYRIYLTKRYRIFYTYGDQRVKLLKVLIRNEGTYNETVLKGIQDDIKDDLEYPIESIFPEYDQHDFEVEEVQEKSENRLLLQKQLKQWLIPEQYWNELLRLENDDQLLEVKIDDIYLTRIIEYLYPTPLAQIQNQPEFKLENADDLVKFAAGQITGFLLNIELTDQQKELINIDNDKPILVKGSPGTGKSILALYRVKELVKAGVKRILFTTHNSALINSSTELLYTLLGGEPEKLGVDIKRVDELAQNYYIQEYGQPKLADEKWAMFFIESAINTVKPSLSKSISESISKLGKEYLLEEILLFIEAWGINTWDEYKEITRVGRKYGFTQTVRAAVWQIYEKWQELIKESGLITIEQIRCKALEIVNNKTSKYYQAVIIDEAQDLSPVALRFLVNLVESQKGIYLTADVAQSLYQRSFTWYYIQQYVAFSGKEKILIRSFRNTQQIAEACPQILFGTNAGDNDTMIIQPSQLNGEQPKIIITDDLIKQAKFIKNFFEESAQTYNLPIYSGSILSPDKTYGELIAQQLTFMGLNTKYIEPEKLKITQNCIKVLSLHSVKGLEFPFVAIIGLKEGMLPKQVDNLPEEDKQEVINQELRLFYVGCSRAMRSLLICGSQSNQSQFLTRLLSDRYYTDYWKKEEM